MGDYFRLVRWKNLLIIGLTQLFFIVIDPYGHYSIDRFLIILVTLLTAAAGYVINDYYDIQADRINKPTKIFIGKSIKPDQSRRLYFALVILSLWIGYYVFKDNIQFLLIINISLFLYSYRLKRWPLVGNLVISYLCALVIIVSNPKDSCLVNSYDNIITYFSFFAFLISMVRELIKDMEDIEGDKAVGYKTFPIVGGIKLSKSLGIISLLSLILVYFYAAFQNINHDDGNSFLPLIGFVVITAFSIFILVKTILAKNQVDFSKLSNYCKILMLVGLGTAILWLF